MYAFIFFFRKVQNARFNSDDMISNSQKKKR